MQQQTQLQDLTVKFKLNGDYEPRRLVMVEVLGVATKRKAIEGLFADIIKQRVPKKFNLRLPTSRCCPGSLLGFVYLKEYYPAESEEPVTFSDEELEEKMPEIMGFICDELYAELGRECHVVVQDNYGNTFECVIGRTGNLVSRMSNSDLRFVRNFN
ncbi:MAG: hypothetical protein LBQ11_01250 [Candidatus Nomurabacteria bacterium]|jgi:hypothetical protein|nr:hypothetical protein [Candidatus Nomurabacteria bacterium]